MTHETEIKLRVSDPEQAAKLLLEHGFALVKERVFERNLIFDTELGGLRTSRQTLRLREAGNQVTLTYKGPAQRGKHKSREEREARLDSFSEMQVILERLGYRVTFQYDKHRTEYAQPGSAVSVATIDETPAGTFMELEGTPEWIDATAASLGFSEADYITSSYATLYTAALAAAAPRRQPPQSQ